MEQDLKFHEMTLKTDASARLNRRDLGLVLLGEENSESAKVSPDDNCSDASDGSRDKEDNDLHYQYVDQDGIVQSLNSTGPLLKCVRRIGASTKIWTKPMVRSLIQCYREYMDEFRDPAIKQKDVWMKAASLMRRIGYNLSWSECDRKWRNLKHTFKTFYYRKNENKRVSWEFYDDLHVLFVPGPEDINKQRHRKSRVLFPPDIHRGTPDDAATTIIPKRESMSRDSPPPPFEIPPKWFTDYMKEFEKRQWLYIEEIRRIYEISLEAERQRHKAMEILVNMIQRDMPK